MGLLSLIVKLGGDSTGFTKSVTQAESRADQFTKKIGGAFSGLKSAVLGIFSTAAMTAWGAKVAQTTNRIKDLTEQFRLTATEVQNVDFAMNQSGLQFEDAAMALTKLGNARREAVEGNEDLRATFEKYGVTLDQLNDPQQRNFDILQKITGAMATMSLTAREQTDIQDLLGAKSAKLLTVLQELSNTKPPALFSDEDIQRLDKADKMLDRVMLKLKIWTAERIGDAASFFGIGEDSIEVKERKSREEAAKPLTFAEIAAANAAKHKRLQDERQSREDGVFELDKDKKPEKHRPSPPSPEEMELWESAGRKRASGFARAENQERLGIFLGGKSDPLVDINKAQLSVLKQIERKVGRSVDPIEALNRKAR